MENLFTKVLTDSEIFRDLLSRVNQKQSVQLCGPSINQRAHILAGLFQSTKNQMLVVAPNEYSARKLYHDLKFYLGEKIVFYMPPQDIYFYDIKARARENEIERSRVLTDLARGKKIIAVTVADNIAKRYMPKEILNKSIIKLLENTQIKKQELIQELVRLGYEREVSVESKGQFSSRGGILDIFAINSSYPYRVEFFDDEIESIRIFDTATQKSIESVKSIEIYPAREVLYPKDDYECPNVSDQLTSRTLIHVKDHLSEIQNRMYFEGLENYIDSIYKESEKKDLFSYLNSKSFVIYSDSSRVWERVKDYQTEFQDQFEIALEKGEAIQNQGNLIYTSEHLFEYASEFTSVHMNLLTENVIDNNATTLSWSCREIQNFGGKLEGLLEEIKYLKKSGYKTILSLGSLEKAKKIKEFFVQEDVDAILLKNNKIENFEASQVVICVGDISEGFLYSEFKVAIITDQEILGSHKKTSSKKKKKKVKNARKIDSFLEMNIGDYVVHETHGIGKYKGMEQIQAAGVKKDYLKILYAGEDILYVPTDQFDKVQKYIGAESESLNVKVNKLGTSEWSKAKAKVKKEIEDMTHELIELYAKREQTKGYSFAKDNQWQKEFESLFPYEETQDQLKAIEEMKKDMESSQVMDRLVCGDVGYGKTEVAIRGIFKACMNSKQVAVLVPTTILAQQHYSNFKERFSKYPIRVEVLSRFKTAKEQASIIEDARKGLVDILIGTHRILSSDIKFKDLGLVVVDEEQRFGVKDKEKLKKIKSSVDVLTLSATPIPRTLHMSLSGIRDMSIIEEPPEERHPVLTFVVEAKESIIADAIERELSRGGQVFFVYNRVKGIEEIASKIKKMVPKARLALGHGQMSPRQLENVMLKFLQKEYDVLVCTTIIETGMDISNANTMIVYDADKMGLAQLYQLRGRVGRAKRQGYAYLMYEKDKVLNEISQKRLKAIKEFTEFGSGFKIAMRDLEIRGAGSILGSKQHGHMAAIGYDLYVKMLEEAVSKIKGSSKEEVVDTEIDLSLDAYIPDYYIDDEITKLNIYKKIASIESKEDMLEIREEIEDRFSNIPKPLSNLIGVGYMKHLGKTLGIKTITYADQKTKIFLEPHYKFKPKEDLKSKNYENLIKEITIEMEKMIEYKMKLNSKN